MLSFRVWSSAMVDDEREEGRAHLHSKGERLQGSESIKTHNAAECILEGKIFLSIVVFEAHRIHDV